MTKSFRTIAAIMDPVTPPTKLTDLAKRHRWMDQTSPEDLPKPLSFRSIALRHSEPENVARFLSYNTALAVVLDFPLSFIDLMTLIDKLKWDVAELVNKLGIEFQRFCEKGLFELGKKFLSEKCDMEWLAKAIGVYQIIQDYIDDCLNFVTCGIWGAITDWSEVTIDILLDAASIKNPFEVIIEKQLINVTQFIRDYLGWDPWTTIVNLGISVAEIIAGWAGEKIEDPLHIPGEDELDVRAEEIGLALTESLNITGEYAGEIKPLCYSIIALCEVFKEKSRKLLRAGQTNVTECLGPGIPEHTNAIQGSGLFQMLKGYRVIEQKMMSFKNRCADDFDIEGWANKGVILTRIDVSFGVIDLFSTHLYSGTNIFTMINNALKRPDAEQTTPAERAAVRKSQLEDIRDFFISNHRKENIAILTGDFNIDGNNNNEYETFKATIENLGLREEWSYQQQVIPKEDPNEPDPGYTYGPQYEEKRIENENDLFFRDPAPRNDENESRLDYIFLEKPKKDHTFNIDISRIRRRHFRRKPQKRVGKEGNLRFMSDHMGLDVTLIFSARTSK